MTGSYTLAAALVGLFGALFLDRLDRRGAAVAAMVGLGLATCAAALAGNVDERRRLRRSGGRPGLAMAAGWIPVARRGRALARVMVALPWPRCWGGAGRPGVGPVGRLAPPPPIGQALN